MGKRRKQNKRRHGLQMITLCVSTTMVLVLLGIVVLSVLTARNLQRHLRENVEISVILADTVSEENCISLGNALSGLPYASGVNYISRDSALAIAKTEMGIDPSEFAGGNPFMPELTIKMAEAYANTDSLEKIKYTLQLDRRVVEVAYTKDEIDGMNHILEPVNLALLVLAGLLIFICYTLINNSVQLSIYARRFNINTMKLVGASWGFIRRPFLSRAVFVGLVSAFLTCIILTGIGYAAYPYMPHIESVLTWRDLVITVVCIFTFGLTIVLLCTLLSVNKYLRMTAGELYKI